MSRRTPATLAEVRADLDHVETALGDMLHILDDHSRCLRVILRMVRHLHNAMANKPRRATRAEKASE